MKSFKHIAIWSVLSLFLFSTGGFSIYIHNCEMSGTTKISLWGGHQSCCKKKTIKPQAKKACCKKKTFTHPVKKKPCCSDKVVKNQLKINNPLASKVKLAFHAFVSEFDFDQAKKHTQNRFNKTFFSDTSPPLSGRDILLRHQVFLI